MKNNTEIEEQTIPQELLDQLVENFLGKKISVEDEKGNIIKGICSSIGLNKFISSWGLQVNFGRYPVTNVKIKSIHLID